MRRTRLAAQGEMPTFGVSGVAILGAENFFFPLLTHSFSYTTYGIRQASYCSWLAS